MIICEENTKTCDDDDNNIRPLPLLHWFSKHLDKTPNQKLMWFLAWCYKNYPSFFVTKNLQPAFMYQFVQHIVSAVHACLKQKWNYNSTVYEPVLELSDGLQIKYLQNVKGNVKNMEKDKLEKLTQR